MKLSTHLFKDQQPLVKLQKSTRTAVLFLYAATMEIIPVNTCIVK